MAIGKATPPEPSAASKAAAQEEPLERYEDSSDWTDTSESGDDSGAWSEPDLSSESVSPSSSLATLGSLDPDASSDDEDNYGSGGGGRAEAPHFPPRQEQEPTKQPGKVPSPATPAWHDGSVREGEQSDGVDAHAKVPNAPQVPKSARQEEADVADRVSSGEAPLDAATLKAIRKDVIRKTNAALAADASRGKELGLGSPGKQHRRSHSKRTE